MKSRNFEANTISSYDFSNMYTTLPHDKINDRLSKVIKWCFDREGKTYMCTSESKGFFSATDYKSYKSWTCGDLCIALSFLSDNIYVRFGEKLYKQVVGIPIGTNCAPLVADLFLYTYEKEFIQNLQKQRKNDDMKCFIGTSRYLDDILTIDNPVFEKYKNVIYPQELILNKANVSNTETPFLDLNIKIVNGEIHTSVYDKRDDFGFNTVNFSWLDGDVPRLPSYCIYISQLIRFKGYRIEVSDKENINISSTCYQDTSQPYPELYQNNTCNRTGRYVRVVQENRSELEALPGPLLELCEVEVYGCPKGKYGTNCTEDCSVNCVDGICEPDNGICRHGCVAGKEGSMCDKECDDYKYGYDCSKTCGHCRNNAICDKVSGFCPNEGCEDMFSCTNGNLALNKPTEADSILDAYPQWSASRAVDGNRTQNVWCGSCLHTKANGNGNSFVRIDLEKTSTISRVEIYYRVHYTGRCNPELGNRTGILSQNYRFKGYRIEVSDNVNINISSACYQDTSQPYPELYQNNTCNSTGRYVRVVQENKSELEALPGPLLELCEVEVYGNFLVFIIKNVMRKYAKKVTMVRTVSSSVETATTILAVTQTVYVSKVATEATKASAVLNVKNKCDDYKYGDGCNGTCGHCRNNAICDKVSGVCPNEECKDGFWGNKCKGCPVGSYGPNCLKCGNCFKDLCRNIDGLCQQGCARGYKGIYCKTVCENGTFSHNCILTCGNCRQNATCDKESGVCPGNECEEGFEGLLCKDEISNSSSPWIIVGIIGATLAFIIIIIGVIVMKRRKNTEFKRNVRNVYENEELRTVANGMEKSKNENEVTTFDDMNGGTLYVEATYEELDNVASEKEASERTYEVPTYSDRRESSHTK
ncbi:hypothetical protein FSP39_023983 [Pinctada imbricata]|uniref:receptor protein-tyrosine kinase n=1 Tax=Pinctada imbricata TaxID=66713 RepID=A0AA89C591_PINIB|nr:hypothetical protein FSP39_023983 [Pinctada imbricata]